MHIITIMCTSWCSQHWSLICETKIAFNAILPIYHYQTKLAPKCQKCKLQALILEWVFLSRVPPGSHGLGIRKRLKIVEALWKHSHTHIKTCGETIMKFALCERQNVEATFILNRSQNLTHSKFGKLHILKYVQNEHFRT